MKIIIEQIQLAGSPGWRATLTTSTGKQFAWCVRHFVDIEEQALEYEASETEAR